jgi:hypothetical protein
MGAIIKACNVVSGVKNTGKECDTAMVATAMLIAIHRSVKFTAEQLSGDPVEWLDDLIHQRKAFPLFGQQAPIRTITNSSESDVLVTLDDGLQVFLRYGIYNRTFETTSGGLCYADALQSLNKSGYSIIEIDQQGQMLARRNSDGTFSGFIVDFMYAPSPILADFKNTPYKNRFQISFSPVEMVNNGIIFQGAEELLSMMGLIDVVMTASSAATTTKLKLNVKTHCAEASLVELFPAEIDQVSNFVVENTASLGTPVSITAGAVVGTTVELTGTFTSGQTYRVKGSSPSVWKGNGITGYDASGSFVDILIP